MWCNDDGYFYLKTEELMTMLGLKEMVDQLANANGVRWYGDVLRKDDGH